MGMKIKGLRHYSEGQASNRLQLLKAASVAAQSSQIHGPLPPSPPTAPSAGQPAPARALHLYDITVCILLHLSWICFLHTPLPPPPAGLLHIACPT